MRRYLPFVIVAAVALLTVAGGTQLYRAKKLPLLKNSAAGADDTGVVHVRGHADAPVTVEEYGDFECPPCGHLAATLREVERDYGARLRVIFRHFPLVVHPRARDAAIAAEAAGMQGHFWEMHDLLYREQGAWSKAADVRPIFYSYADVVGINAERFKQDMVSPRVRDRVAADQDRGTSVGVTVTPTLFVNNQQVPKASDPAVLRKAIDEALSAKPKGDPQPDGKK